MNKYEAAVEFLRLVKEHPDDFDAKHDSGRDHSMYTVYNKYTDVSVNIEARNGLRVCSASHGIGLTFVSEPVLRELYDWCVERINMKNIQKNVDKDNEGITTLINYYNKEV